MFRRGLGGRDIGIQAEAGTVSAGVGVQSARRLGKEFWGPLTFEGRGRGHMKGDWATECRLMETGGGESFKEGMVPSFKHCRRVPEDGD